MVCRSTQYRLSDSRRLAPSVNPHLSVVIPVFNRSWELRRALESLARQTAKNFEVIVCDDGSTEDIRAVVTTFEHQLDVQYQRIENSGGPARPRNVAIGLARGEWIAFLDSDDWWDDERLAVVSAELGAGIDFLYHPLRVVIEQGVTRTLERRTVIGEPLRGNALRHFALFGNPVPNSAAVVRRSLLLAIGGICEEPAIVAEDFDTWLRLLERGARICFLNQTLGSYWVGEDGISAFSRRQIDGQIALFKRHAPHFDADLRVVAEACHNYMIGSLLFQIGEDLPQARKRLWHARRLPLLSMRLKRWLKLAMIALKNP
jgi:glycosyltransferase involved in cell wall biosynthesis